MKKNIVISIDREYLNKLAIMFPAESNSVELCQKAIHYYIKDYERKFGEVPNIEYSNVSEISEFEEKELLEKVLNEYKERQKDSDDEIIIAELETN